MQTKRLAQIPTTSAEIQTLIGGCLYWHTLYNGHRLLKIRTDGRQSRVRELGSIGIFCIFSTIL